MPRFLVQASYNREGISALIANPEDRAAAIRQMVEGMGGGSWRASTTLSATMTW